MRSRPDRGNFVGDLDMNISLVLADEQPVCLVGLKTLLEGYPEFEVRASCSDGEQALRAVEEHLPDILVADLRLPVLGTLELLRQIEARKLAVRVVVLADGFEFEGERYRSLSAIAKAVTGSHINGFRFFNLEGRR